MLVRKAGALGPAMLFHSGMNIGIKLFGEPFIVILNGFVILGPLASNPRLMVEYTTVLLVALNALVILVVSTIIALDKNQKQQSIVAL